ncbi:MAG: transposase [Nitrospirae bacterium]|nr:transposase [Nitrospirota bacterium]
MARKPRILFPGALYHVISRGNQRRAIFLDDEDRLRYLDRLEHYRTRYDVSIYAYVLMSNHVHLLVETSITPLSKFMQGLQFTYTQRFNRKYRKVGHLFQGRYKAILCDRDAYLLALVRYIHLNPARTRKHTDPFRFRWSSHRAYLGKRTGVGVRTDVVLGQLGGREGSGRRGYVRFLRDGLGMGHQAEYYEAVDQRLLGGDGFVREVDRRAGRSARVSIGERRARWGELIRAVSVVTGQEAEALVGRGRGERLVMARSLLAYLGREWGRMKVVEMGERMGRDPTAVSRLIGRWEGRRDEGAMQRVASCLDKLQNHA